MKKKKIFAWFLVAAWMLVIFSFSSRNGDKSDGQSKTVVKNAIISTMNVTSTVGLTEKISNKDAKKIADKVNRPIRKIAHISEYFILFILVYNALLKSNVKKRILLYALIFCFLYALTDEFHQLFITDRSSEFRDVLIDTAGSTFALVLCYFFNTLTTKHYKKLLKK